MARRPVIGVTSGIIPREPWSPVWYGQSNTYSDALIAAGGLPVFLPLTDDEGVLKGLYGLCDGLLMAGGDDIEIVPNLRDRTETKFITWALEDQKPLFGVCRGMQLINQVLGGNLYREIADDVSGALDHDASRAARQLSYVIRTMRLEPASAMARYLGAAQVGINEYHHQSIHKLGKGLRAVGWTDDGVIEAVEGDGEAFLQGVQCHPESLARDISLPWYRLFEALVMASGSGSRISR